MTLSASAGAQGSAPVAAPAPGDVPTEQARSADADDVIVVTASRREEQLNNAPATMTVVTEDVINTAPNLSVTDLLRLVPGVNAAQMSARDVNITLRAPTGTLSDSTLVLLDGRSIYQDFFGFVLWDFLPVDTSEIRQVEVIRGPASAVWGANAMTGVINVISRTPREMLGTSVGIRFGQFDRSRRGTGFDAGGLFSVNVVHAQAPSDRLAFKVSASLQAQEAFLRPAGPFAGTSRLYPSYQNKGTTQPKVDGRVDYTGADGRRLIVAAGTAGTAGIVHTGLGPLDIEPGATLSYARATYYRNLLKLQVFTNLLHASAPALLQVGLDAQPLRFTFDNQVYDVEVANAHVLRGRHVLSYGGNYRHNRFDISAASRGDRRDEGGAYVQDQVFLSDRVRWIVGARVDRFSVLHRMVVSPRTTLMLKPRESQTLRLSFNQAFRAPSFINSFFDLSFLQSANLVAGETFQFPVQAVGNIDLREEQLTAYEVAYSGRYRAVSLGVAAYVNRVRNMIQFTQADSYTGATPPPAWPLPPVVLDRLLAAGQGLPSRFTYRNFDRMTDRGIEASVDARLTPAVTVFANYSWQAPPSVVGFPLSEVNRPPPHRFNAGAGFSRGRYFGNGSVSVIDRAFWQDVDGYAGETAPYMLVNAGLGVRSTDRTMTVAVRANNLLNGAIQQHVFGDIVKRTITGEVRFQF